MNLHKLTRVLLVAILFTTLAGFTPLPRSLEKVPEYAALTIPSTTKSYVTMLLPPEFMAEYGEVWSEIQNQLEKAQNTEFTFQVTGMGGDALMLNNFIRAIQDAQTNGNIVNMDVIGPAASAHAFITCFANKVTIRDGASLLFHQAYGIISLFFGTVQIRALASDSIITNITDLMLNTCLINGRLTEEDANVIKSGDDVIILHKGQRMIKQYAHDNASILNYTLPVFMVAMSDLLCVLFVIGSIAFVIKRTGNKKSK